jgi:hypothetical protein
MNWRMKVVCFYCLLAGVLLACSGTATPLLTPTTFASMTPSFTPTSSNTGCIPWSDINASHNEKNICAFGDIVRIENAKGMGFYLIRFADSAALAFYVMQNFEPAVRVGECINVTGTLYFDNNGMPFMDGGASEIRTCNPES